MASHSGVAKTTSPAVAKIADRTAYDALLLTIMTIISYVRSNVNEMVTMIEKERYHKKVKFLNVCGEKFEGIMSVNG